MVRKATTKRRNVAENCILCANAPLLLLTSLSGLSCFRFKCEHTLTRNRCVIGPSKWMVFTSMILCSVTITDISYQMHTTFASNGANHADILRLIMDACTSLSVVLMFSCLWDTKHRIKCYKRLMALLLARKSFGISTVFSAQRMRKLRATSTIYALAIVFVCLIYGVLLGKRLVKVGPTYVLLSTALSFSMDAEIFEAFFRRIYWEMKRVVINRAISSIGGGLGTFDFIGRLRRLQRYHVALCLNLKILNRFLNVSGVFAVLIAVDILVIYCYILVNSFIGAIHFEAKEFVEILFVLCACMSALVYALRRFSSLSNCGDDISSFLFRYPITKLTSAEAAQIECVLASLKIQKPILKASDIVVFGTRLLTSILGTVVTYVLVALQFNPSWIDSSNVERN